MKFEDYLRILRERWIIVVATVVVAVLIALTLSLASTKKYEASTRLFVSVPSTFSVNDVYQGSLFSQQRVASYTQLLTGEPLAQLTIDKLKLDMSASELASKVTAKFTAETVLIDVTVTDTSAERAARIANELSDQFSGFVKNLETPEGGWPAAAKVVVEQRAAVPTDPAFPRTKLNLALGLGIGLLLGAWLAIVADRMDRSVRTRKEAGDIAGAGVIGSIPPAAAHSAPPIVAFDDASTPSAEAYRELRTNLQFLDVTPRPKVIVVTSPARHEGKTTTAINIALVLAEAGSTVALVDADLRFSRMSEYLEMETRTGLSDVLAGDESLKAVLKATEFEGVSFLAAGTLPQNPSVLLAADATEKALTELRDQFDYVVVDSAPVLPFTDTILLAKRADGTVLVVRTGKTKRQQLEDAAEKLSSSKAKLLGTVLTSDPSRSIRRSESKTS